MKNLKNALWTSLGYLLILTAISTPLFAGFVSVPEVDPSMVGGAVALLVGGYLVVVSRTRRK